MTTIRLTCTLKFAPGDRVIHYRQLWPGVVVKLLHGPSHREEVLVHWDDREENYIVEPWQIVLIKKNNRTTGEALAAIHEMDWRTGE